MPPKPKPPNMPITLQQLAGVLNSVSTGIKALLASSPNQKLSVQNLLVTFLTDPIIAKNLGKSHPAVSILTTLPNIAEDMKSIKASLVALQKAITPKSTQSKPPESMPVPPRLGLRSRINHSLF
jgi:hypothetical protein